MTEPSSTAAHEVSRVVEAAVRHRTSAGRSPIADPGRIRSLDGLRAVSIGLVLVAHLSGTRHFLPDHVGNFFHAGDLGVRVFFVISGFLITRLLLEEVEVRGRIHLGKFYLRRTFRIFPPYYAFLVVLLMIDAAGWLTLHAGDLTHAFTYTSNYNPGRSWQVGHTWSLAVEEQFYLVWPAVLLLLGRRRALWVAGGFFVASPFLRLLLWHLGGPSIGVGHRFETVADAIAIGCVLAASAEWLRAEPRCQAFMNSRWFWLVPALVVSASLLEDRPRLSFLFGFSIMNLGIAACIHWCVMHHDGRIGRVLNSAPLVYVGALSYSVYLWQQIFLNRESGAALNQFPANLLCAAAASLVSYYAVERPSLALRRHLERWWFPAGRPEGTRATEPSRPRPVTTRRPELPRQASRAAPR